jgi:hypothetical protein
VRCRVLPSWAFVDASAHPEAIALRPHGKNSTEYVVCTWWEENMGAARRGVRGGRRAWARRGVAGGCSSKPEFGLADQVVPEIG